MILTHGNIKKSRILKYIFLDLPDDELLSAYEENSAQYTIFDGLHDSKIRITKSGSDIVIDFSKSRHGGTQTPRSLTFSDAKIISQNRVSKNGHIAKLNKNKEAEFFKNAYDDKIPRNQIKRRFKRIIVKTLSLDNYLYKH